jgi:HSP20 family protein
MSGELVLSYDPGLTITEDEEHVYVEAALPGVRPEDIDLSFKNGVLQVMGEVSDEEREGRKSYARMTSNYAYQVAVPGIIDMNAEPEAYAENGVVCVVFTKMSEMAPKKITLKAKTQKGKKASAKSAPEPEETDESGNVEAPKSEEEEEE